MPLTQSQARAKIAQLIATYRKLDDTQRKLTTESSVVHQFLDPLFDVLGWPVDDPARYKYELSTQAGRPDMTLIPDQGGTIFVEAKRFGLLCDSRFQRYSHATLCRGALARNRGQHRCPRE